MTIKCKWCKTALSTTEPGWHNCKCGAISVDVSTGYFRVLGNLEDQELLDD